MEEKENENLYKFVGYSVIVAVIIGIVAVCGYLIYYHTQRVGVIYCEFPYIGGLLKDDAFEINGKNVGMVKHIYSNEPNRVILTINLKKPIVINEGYRLFISDIGIMDERVVSLENGPPEAPLVNLSDTLVGIYYPGISDMLGRVQELRDFLDDVLIFVNNIQHGSDTARSIVEWLNSAEETIERVAASAVNALQGWDGDLPEILQQMNDFSEKLNRDLTKFGKQLPDIFEKTNTIIEECDTLLTKLAEIRKLSGTIENFVGKIDDNLDINSINEMLSEWQEKIQVIWKEAHKLQLWIRLGWKN